MARARPRGTLLASSIQPAVSSTVAPAPPAALLSIRSVSKNFGSLAVLHHLSLEVGKSEFLTILGESGSGKTTLLRLIAGFEAPDSGEIWMGGERLDLLPPYRRRVNTVFQSYALFPHLSVFENVAYGLRVQGTPSAEVAARVEESLSMVKMNSFAKSAPGRLSGGQQQRVALARALINRPRLLLLDEPLSALDANLRREMQHELQSLQREVGISFVFVTHDQAEAMALSDRIALLRAGELEQVASSRELYRNPATAYCARFIGQTNLLHARVEGGWARWGALFFRCDPAPRKSETGAAGDAATFSLRPEDIRPASPHAPAADGNTVRFPATITRRHYQGANELVEIQTSDGQSLIVVIPSGSLVSPEANWEFESRNAIRVRDLNPGAPQPGSESGGE